MSDGSARTVTAWGAVLHGELIAAMGEGEVDILAGAAPGVLVVGADDWTLTVEGIVDASEAGPSPVSRLTAWLAIDDEPEEPSRYAAARRVVMPIAVEQALARADAALGGDLQRALEDGADPFSRDLAAALGTSQGS